MPIAIPAAGTCLQRAAGIHGTAEQMAEDASRKKRGPSALRRGSLVD
jgi:hypothetical protein